MLSCRIPLCSALLALCAGLVFARSELTARDRVAVAVHALTFGASPPQAPQSKGARAVGELPDRGAAGALSGHVTDTPIQTPLTARLGYHSPRKTLLQRGQRTHQKFLFLKLFFEEKGGRPPATRGGTLKVHATTRGVRTQHPLRLPSASTLPNLGPQRCRPPAGRRARERRLAGNYGHGASAVLIPLPNSFAQTTPLRSREGRRAAQHTAARRPPSLRECAADMDPVPWGSPTRQTPPTPPPRRVAGAPAHAHVNCSRWRLCAVASAVSAAAEVRHAPAPPPPRPPPPPSPPRPSPRLQCRRPRWLPSQSCGG